jgi:hypothetical protein
MATKKRTASAIGRQNRRRGGAYERFVADRMRAVFGGARRGIGQARSGGDVPDVEGCADFWVQCKNVKAPNLFKAMAQAQDELRTRRLQSHAPCHYSVPLVVARRTGEKEDLVALRLDDFVDLLEKLTVHMRLQEEAQRLDSASNAFDAAASVAP